MHPCRTAESNSIIARGRQNEPSNAMCLSLGFSSLGPLDYGYKDLILRCNHWELDLRDLSTRE